jgi:chemotaxis protein methyltransferase CheR
MRDADCVEFLRWALPRMGLRWRGFRRVRRQVCRRLQRRLQELGLPDLTAYRTLLDSHPAEWDELDGLCRVTISSFCRDAQVFEILAREVLPQLAGQVVAPGRLRVWSAGCASGEEPYTLSILGRHASELRAVALDIVATDTDSHLLERAHRGWYPESSLREVPPAWKRRALEPAGQGEYRLRPGYREDVTFLRQDVRRQTPLGPFHLILCRNLVFTYYTTRIQEEVLERLRSALVSGGFLVIGRREELPPGAAGFRPWPTAEGIMENVPGS